MEDWEIKCAELGGKMGGEYLQSIGKFNLIELSKEEWLIFCQCICKEFHRAHAIQQSGLSLQPQDIPF